MALEYSTVRINITTIAADGIDVDDIPDDTPLTGSLELTPMIAAGSAIQYDDGGTLKLKTVSPITVDIGVTGDISHQGRDYVKVLAPTASTTNLAQLQWRASFKNLRYGSQVITMQPIYFYATPGAEINLADNVNVAPSSLAVQLSRGPRGFGIGEVATDLATDELVFKLDDDSETEVGRLVLPEAEVSDVAVANLVAADTATKAALDGTYATSAEASFLPAGKPNGAPAAADTGQALTLFGIAPLTVSGGKLVHAQATVNNSGGYVQVPLSGPVIESVMEFEFPVATNGVVTLAWPPQNWANGATVDFTQVVGLHLTLSRTTWKASTYDGPNATVDTTVYGSGTFTTPLALAVTHRVAASLDRASGTVTITLPDGSMHNYTNAFLTTNTGPFAVFELYEQFSTAAPAVITKITASAVPAKSERVRMRDVLPALVKATAGRDDLVKKWAPATTQRLAPTASLAVIDSALALNGFVVPDSGYFMVSLQGQIAMSAAAQVYWAIFTDTGSNLGQTIVVTRDTASADQKLNAVLKVEWLCQRPPGTVVNLIPRHLATVADSTYFKVGSDNSAILRAWAARASS